MRINQRVFFILLFSLICLPGLTEEQFRIESPRFALSCLEFELKIHGLSENVATFPVLITDAGETIFKGEKSASELKSVKIKLSHSGKREILVKVGEKENSVIIRVIPGWLSLLPPLIAILLSLLTREVVMSLLLGVWVGSFLVNDYSIFLGFLRAIDKYILEGLADPGRASIVIFSVTLGGMVGILNQTGGMQGIVQLISKIVVGPKTAQIATWLMGIIIFFDDYANTLIVGNSMRPITDKNKVSREKLSYIVDSTSAPVAGIAVLSTWVGYEIGLIRQAFIDLNIPETNFYGVFLQTIPFRFYCLLSLFFGFLICTTDYEFGPMFEAEKRARTEGKPLADNAVPISSPESAMPVLPEEMPKRWYNAAIPICVVILGTMLGLIYNGGGFNQHFDAVSISFSDNTAGSKLIVDHLQPDMGILIGETHDRETVKINYKPCLINNSSSDGSMKVNIESLEKGAIIWIATSTCSLTNIEKLRAAFADANSAAVLLWVSVFGSIVALALGLLQRLVTISSGIQAWLNGARAMVLAMIILILAWSINGVCKELNTAGYIIECVKGVLTPWLVPVITFVVACFISFATGTSWGTMAILLPLSIPLAYHLNVEYYNKYLANTPQIMPMIDYVKAMLLVSIGAVLEGSIFGDHCSPISDTTIMSSMASGADHIDHVKTQMPYAITVATVALSICYLPCGLGYSPYYCLVASIICLYALLRFLGKKV